jgi:hypothetical protein
MHFTATFSMADIEAEINKQIEINKKVVINTMIYIGKECVNEARGMNTYEDQTGNLRSSIGFMVLSDGVVVHQSAFPVIKKGSKGKTEGTTFLNSLIAEHSIGIVLVVVAGMKYASYVEAMNLVVLSTAELLAERRVPELLNQLGFKTR